VYPLKIEFLKKGGMQLKPLSKITITDLWKEVKDEESIWEDLKLEAQIMLKNLLESMEEEFIYYLKARKYQRSSERGSYRNGYYIRSLDTELGVISKL
jgi:transposase-like protein